MAVCQPDFYFCTVTFFAKQTIIVVKSSSSLFPKDTRETEISNVLIQLFITYIAFNMSLALVSLWIKE